MILSTRFKRTLFLGSLFAVLSMSYAAGTAAPQAEDTSAIDVTHYKINAELLPDSHTLKAQAVSKHSSKLSPSYSS
jgi:hypothetical protein